MEQVLNQIKFSRANKIKVLNSSICEGATCPGPGQAVCDTQCYCNTATIAAAATTNKTDLLML